MSEEVFYLPELKRGLVQLDEEESHHLRVRRVKIGREVVLTDGKGRWANALVKEIKGTVLLEVNEIKKLKDESRVKVCACVPLLKGEDTGLVIRALTEIGVDLLCVFVSSRTVPAFLNEGAKKKLERWRRIVVEACKQSRRFIFPELRGIYKFREVLRLNHWDVKVIMWENRGGTRLRDIVEMDFDSILFVSGPEGGFDEAEIEEAKSHGFSVIWLGDKILRARTAPLYFMSVIDFTKR